MDIRVLPVVLRMLFARLPGYIILGLEFFAMFSPCRCQGAPRLEKMDSIAPLHFEDALANSSDQFSDMQGEFRWSYGYCKRSDLSNNEESGEFHPFSKCIYGIWRHTESSAPWISRTSLCPGQADGAILTPIRRWRTVKPGSVRLVGFLQRQHSGTGDLRCKVFVNGVEHWSYPLASNDTVPHCFDILLLDVPANAAIDMVLIPSSMENDGAVTWETQIVPEPCTAWSPNLPIGPTFTPEQKEAQRAAGAALLQQIQSAASKNSPSFIIPPGDYRFSADWNIYPHLKNIRNMIITAKGVTFWFDPPDVFGLEFDDCRNVTVTGLTLDYDPLPFFQARITAIDPAAGTVTGEIMRGYTPTETSGNRTVFYYRPDGSFIRNGVIQCQWSRDGDNVVVKAPAPGVKVGDYMACPIRTGQTLRVIGCGGMTFKDCNLYSGGGMGVMDADGPGGDVFIRVRCTRRPGTNRLQAFGADGFHFSVLGRGPVLDECEAAYLADDEINVHGRFGSVVKRLGPNRYIIAGEDSPFVPGGRLSFWDFSTLMPLGDSVVKSVTPSPDGKNWNVTLKQNLNLPVGALVDPHRMDCRYYVIRNCWFHDTPQRFLINGAPYGLIENNTFQNTGGNVNIHEESWAGWTEGCFASGTIFRNNRILGCGVGGASAEAYFQGAIMVVVVPGGGNYLRHSTPVQNITIENNYLEDVPGVPIYVTNVNGLKIKGNVICKPFDSPGWKGFDKPLADTCGDLPNAPIFLASVRNAFIDNNRVYDPLEFVDNRTVATGPIIQNVSVNGKPLWNTIADFITGWTPEPSQGGNGWSYGYIDAQDILSDTYPVSDFHPFAVNADGWRSAPGQYPVIWRTRMHPGVNLAAVRRWVSYTSDNLKIEGVVQCPSPSSHGDIACIYQDGVRVWEQDTADHQPHSFRVLLKHVKRGTMIDFVVAPHGDIDYDSTIFYAKIMSEPRIASRSVAPKRNEPRDIKKR
jgi:hypothetical protein